MRVEINRIAGDIYINGEKKIFAVDFDAKNPKKNAEEYNVDWLIGWAKVGLLSMGHTVPHFEIKGIQEFGNTQPMVGDKGP